MLYIIRELPSEANNQTYRLLNTTTHLEEIKQASEINQTNLKIGMRIQLND